MGARVRAEADRAAERALVDLLVRIRPKTRPVDPVLGGFFLLHALRNTLGMTCFRDPERLRSSAAHEELSRLPMAICTRIDGPNGGRGGP